MAFKIMEVVEATKPKLAERAREMRATGSSFDTIASMLRSETGMSIGREAVREWFKRQGIGRGTDGQEG